MKRLQLTIKEESIGWKWMNNTVIITYDKPVEVKEKEQEMLRLAHKAAMS